MRRSVSEVTFYCQKCGNYSIILVGPNVKLKKLKCGKCKADYTKLKRVKS